MDVEYIRTYDLGVAIPATFERAMVTDIQGQSQLAKKIYIYTRMARRYLRCILKCSLLPTYLVPSYLLLFLLKNDQTPNTRIKVNFWSILMAGSFFTK